jgi:hypothetical protein
MNRDTIQKLLGGYATGTLTPEEQQALFAAALDDQELFDALAREQSLRDLLRDPAARAQVLTAIDSTMDTAAPRWYQTRRYQTRWYKTGWWLPAAAAVAMAGIGLMAVVAVRRQAHAPAPAMVAELKPAAPVPAPPLADSGGTARRTEPRPRLGSRGSSTSGSVAVKPRAMAQPRAMPQPRPGPAGISVVAGVPGLELPPAPAVNSPIEVRADQPALVTAARKDEAAQPLFTPAPYVQNQQQPAMFQAAASNESKTLDGPLNARLLFYANPVELSAGSVGRLEIASGQESKKKAAPAQMRAASGMVAAKSVASAAAHPGVRCSILRKQPNGEFAEVALDTVLDGGEAVTLKFVPNGYGYLVIWEMGLDHEWRTLAKGAAEPYKAFETPLPNAGANGLVRGSGPRQLYVQFTRNAPAGLGAASFQTLVTQAPAKPTQAAAEVPDPATYIVNSASDPSSPSLMFIIWLHYK